LRRIVERDCHNTRVLRRAGGAYRARREPCPLMRLFLALAAAAAALLASSSGTAAAATSSGGIYVVSLPSGADVWIDGTYCGRSPVLVDALTQGRHMATLTRAGWNVQEAQVDVSGGGVVLWSTRLSAGSRGSSEKATGEATLRGLPQKTKVSIDGAPAREAYGAISLAEGPHTVTFAGLHGAVTRSFTVLPDMSSELLLREAPASVSPAHAGVIAPVTDYLPPEAVEITGRTLRIRYQGHEAIAHIDRVWMRVDGKTVSYNSAPATINGKLYLPLDLLDLLTK
jgi:hypothetical protein